MPTQSQNVHVTWGKLTIDGLVNASGPRLEIESSNGNSIWVTGNTTFTAFYTPIGGSRSQVPAPTWTTDIGSIAATGVFSTTGHTGEVTVNAQYNGATGSYSLTVKPLAITGYSLVGTNILNQIPGNKIPLHPVVYYADGSSMTLPNVIHSATILLLEGAMPTSPDIFCSGNIVTITSPRLDVHISLQVIGIVDKIGPVNGYVTFNPTPTSAGHHYDVTSTWHPTDLTQYSRDGTIDRLFSPVHRFVYGHVNNVAPNTQVFWLQGPTGTGTAIGTTDDLGDFTFGPLAYTYTIGQSIQNSLLVNGVLVHSWTAVCHKSSDLFCKIIDTNGTLLYEGDINSYQIDSNRFINWYGIISAIYTDGSKVQHDWKAYNIGLLPLHQVNGPGSLTTPTTASVTYSSGTVTQNGTAKFSAIWLDVDTSPTINLHIISPPIPYGTKLHEYCASGYSTSLFGVYADGNGGRYEEVIDPLSWKCGYVVPQTPFILTVPDPQQSNKQFTWTLRGGAPNGKFTVFINAPTSMIPSGRYEASDYFDASGNFVCTTGLLGGTGLALWSAVAGVGTNYPKNALQWQRIVASVSVTMPAEVISGDYYSWSINNGPPNGTWSFTATDSPYHQIVGIFSGSGQLDSNGNYTNIIQFLNGVDGNATYNFTFSDGQAATAYVHAKPKATVVYNESVVMPGAIPVGEVGTIAISGGVPNSNWSLVVHPVGSNTTVKTGSGSLDSFGNNSFAEVIISSAIQPTDQIGNYVFTYHFNATGHDRVYYMTARNPSPSPLPPNLYNQTMACNLFAGTNGCPGANTYGTATYDVIYNASGVVSYVYRGGCTIPPPSYPPADQLINSYCDGANLTGNYTNGSGGTYVKVIAYNSPSCGYVGGGGGGTFSPLPKTTVLK